MPTCIGPSAGLGRWPASKATARKIYNNQSIRCFQRSVPSYTALTSEEDLANRVTQSVVGDRRVHWRQSNAEFSKLLLNVDTSSERRRAEGETGQHLKWMFRFGGLSGICLTVFEIIPFVRPARRSSSCRKRFIMKSRILYYSFLLLSCLATTVVVREFQINSATPISLLSFSCLCVCCSPSSAMILSCRLDIL